MHDQARSNLNIKAEHVACSIKHRSCQELPDAAINSRWVSSESVIQTIATATNGRNQDGNQIISKFANK